MAGKACHVLASTTQVGLIQALGRTGESSVPISVTASLRMRHPSADLSYCTRQLDLEPNRQWVAGEPRTSPVGRPLGGVQPDSYWCAPLVLDQESDIENFLASTLDRLETYRSVFDQCSATGGSAELFIGFFLEAFNGGFSLQPQLLAKAASLGIALDFDIYGHEDDPSSAP